MAKVTYGKNGNVAKVNAKKEKEKKEETPSKPRQKRKKPEELVEDLLDNTNIKEEVEIAEIPEYLRLQVSPEEQALYDNSYITQVYNEYKNEVDKEDIEDYVIQKIRDKINREENVFTDWDVKIGDEIKYFDPDLSYELTGYRPITETKGLDFNPDWFREDALAKINTGKYQMYAPGGPAYIEFWVERQRRCIEGYTSHGYTITGWNYFYLNFYRMLTPPSANKPENEDSTKDIKDIKDARKRKVGYRKKKKGRQMNFPMFLAKQYEYFHYLELCRVLDKDALVLKGRGLGFSEMGANNVVCMYTCERDTQSLVTAFDRDKLDRTLEKAWAQLDFLNTETEGGFKHLRQALNTQIQKKASMRDKEGNESGFLSKITGIVADKPSKVRGDRAELLIYEEAGSNGQLRKQWIQGDALINVLGERIGFKMAFGTGGDSGEVLQELEIMFTNPTGFNILPYKHNYTSTGAYTLTAYFIPSYAIVLKPGIIDARGVTNTKLAKEYLQKGRDTYITDPFAYVTHCAEYCWTPEEALSQKGENMFNQNLIAARLTDIEVHNKGIKPEIGIVDYIDGLTENDPVKYKFIKTPNGKVRVYEHPKRDENGQLIRNLYIAGIDSIDQGVSQSTGQTDTSSFALVIKRRAYGIHPEKIVCIYKDRPMYIKEAYNQTIKLLEWYGAKAVVESSRTAIVNYFQDKRKQNLLMKKLQAASSSEVNRYKQSTMYGVYPSKNVIDLYLELIGIFIEDYSNEIDDIELLHEMRDYSYNNKRKYDLIAALGMAELGDQELRLIGDIGISEKRPSFKKIGYYIDENGQKRFGAIPDKSGVPKELRDLIDEINEKYK